MVCSQAVVVGMFKNKREGNVKQRDDKEEVNEYLMLISKVELATIDRSSEMQFAITIDSANTRKEIVVSPVPLWRLMWINHPSLITRLAFSFNANLMNRNE